MGYLTKQQFAIEQKNKKKLLDLCPGLDDESGIYFYTRVDENGFKYAYIGQALHLFQRNLGHLRGYQHIDLSIKKHGLYSEKNPYGWKLNFLHFSKAELDEKEQFYIKQYALNGYQLRNKTSGSQGEGKAQIDDYKPHKGYRDGIEQGYKNCAKDIRLLMKHLDVTTKNNPPTYHQKNAMDKFNEIVGDNNV